MSGRAARQAKRRKQPVWLTLWHDEDEPFRVGSYVLLGFDFLRVLQVQPHPYGCLALVQSVKPVRTYRIA